MASFSELLTKMAEGKRLTPMEKDELRRFGTQTEMRNSFVAGNTTAENTLNINFPFSPIFSEQFAANTTAFDVRIPPDYKHLIVVTSGRQTSASTGNDIVYGQFNGDTGNNYSVQDVWGTGSTASANEASGIDAIYIGIMAGGGMASSLATSTFCFIPNYNSPFYKYTIMIQSGYGSGGQRIALLSSGLWSSTEKIQTIKFLPIFGSAFATGSAISVYGLF